MSNVMEPFSFLAGTELLGTGRDGWTLDQYPQEPGERAVLTHVTFSRPFRAAPLVHLGLAGFDIDNRDAARLTVAAANVTTDGFDIVLGTWLNTRMWRAEVNWLALGAS